MLEAAQPGELDGAVNRFVVALAQHAQWSDMGVAALLDEFARHTSPAGTSGGAGHSQKPGPHGEANNTNTTHQETLLLTPSRPANPLGG